MAEPTPAADRDLSDEKLRGLAESLGIDPSRHAGRPQLEAAVESRRRLIAAMDREALLDVIRWARRPVAVNASKQQLAIEVVRLRSMRFEGLSDRGLTVLAQLRGVDVSDRPPRDQLVKRLEQQEGFWARLGRKRRAWMGSIISGMLGADSTDAAEAAPQASRDRPASSVAAAGSIKDDIEDSGLFGGIAERLKRSADVYLNQKLDEIEARIDRKLDEIDRRLAEWRDKEIASRVRILKITLWVSVIVALLSLLYTWIKVKMGALGG